MFPFNPVWKSRMPLLSTSNTDPATARLAASDWIVAALDSLRSQGIEAVQITALARALGVTRGSFYWHFESREALLTAIIAEWRARNTGVMVEAIADTPTLDHGILALFSVWVDHTRFDPTLDQAIRDWARHDDTLMLTVKDEDLARVTAISGLFKRFGYPPADALIRARVIYFTQISFYAMRIEEDESMEERMGYLAEYFRCFTGREIDPDIADAYRVSQLNGDTP
jgi:AcrR family transcriptional regulator